MRSNCKQEQITTMEKMTAIATVVANLKGRQKDRGENKEQNKKKRDRIANKL